MSVRQVFVGSKNRKSCWKNFPQKMFGSYFMKAGQAYLDFRVKWCWYLQHQCIICIPNTTTNNLIKITHCSVTWSTKFDSSSFFYYLHDLKSCITSNSEPLSIKSCPCHNWIHFTSKVWIVLALKVCISFSNWGQF